MLTTASCEHSGAKAKDGVVGDANGVGFVLGSNDGCDRSEHLFVICRHAFLHICQNRRWIECTRTFGNYATQNASGTTLD